MARKFTPEDLRRQLIGLFHPAMMRGITCGYAGEGGGVRINITPAADNPFPKEFIAAHLKNLFPQAKEEGDALVVRSAKEVINAYVKTEELPQEAPDRAAPIAVEYTEKGVVFLVQLWVSGLEAATGLIAGSYRDFRLVDRKHSLEYIGVEAMNDEAQRVFTTLFGQRTNGSGALGRDSLKASGVDPDRCFVMKRDDFERAIAAKITQNCINPPPPPESKPPAPITTEPSIEAVCQRRLNAKLPNIKRDDVEILEVQGINIQVYIRSEAARVAMRELFPDDENVGDVVTIPAATFDRVVGGKTHEARIAKTAEPLQPMSGEEPEAYCQRRLAARLSHMQPQGNFGVWRVTNNRVSITTVGDVGWYAIRGLFLHSGWTGNNTSGVQDHIFWVPVDVFDKAVGGNTRAALPKEPETETHPIPEPAGGTFAEKLQARLSRFLPGQKPGNNFIVTSADGKTVGIDTFSLQSTLEIRELFPEIKGTSGIGLHAHFDVPQAVFDRVVVDEKTPLEKTQHPLTTDRYGSELRSQLKDSAIFVRPYGNDLVRIETPNSETLTKLNERFSHRETAEPSLQKPGYIIVATHALAEWLEELHNREAQATYPLKIQVESIIHDLLKDETVGNRTQISVITENDKPVAELRIDTKEPNQWRNIAAAWRKQLPLSRREKAGIPDKPDKDFVLRLPLDKVLGWSKEKAQSPQAQSRG